MEFVRWLIFIKIVSQAIKRLKEIVMIEKDCVKRIIVIEKDWDY